MEIACLEERPGNNIKFISTQNIEGFYSNKGGNGKNNDNKKEKFVNLRSSSSYVFSCL
jgi:hypothetical protein